jgi:glycosyltransferase involved in cell wall biosynthesis
MKTPHPGKMKRKRIVFVLPDLDLGGAQRIVTLLTRFIDKNIYAPYLIVVADNGMLSDEIDSQTQVQYLGGTRLLHMIPRLLIVLRKIRPDYLFSSLAYLNIAIILFKKLPFFNNTCFIARETSVLSLSSPAKFGKILPALYRSQYRRYDRLIAQSEMMKSDLVRNFNVPEHRIRIINNPINHLNIFDLSNKGHNEVFQDKRKHLITVGSLRPVKNFTFLVDAMQYLEPSKYQLTIIGNGSEKARLVARIDELHLKNIRFIHNCQNPFPYVRNADLFLLCSLHEAYPNVVLESILLGTPVLSLNSPGGISEIIRNWQNGYILDSNSPAEYAAQIEKMILYRHFDHNMGQKIIDKHDPIEVGARFQKILAECNNESAL